eukprot:1196091-Prorocentrum_minimum.AAC.4
MEVGVLGDVLHEDVVGEVDGALDVRVVAPGHGAVHALVRPRDERLVPLHVVRDVRGAVPQRLLVEDAEALVDGVALVLEKRNPPTHKVEIKLLLMEWLLCWSRKSEKRTLHTHKVEIFNLEIKRILF